MGTFFVSKTNIIECSIRSQILREEIKKIWEEIKKSREVIKKSREAIKNREVIKP